jgi:hypothetical protein
MYRVQVPDSRYRLEIQILGSSSNKLLGSAPEVWFQILDPNKRVQVTGFMT